MKISLLFATILILNSSAVTSAPHHINALQATPTIDGTISKNEWPEQHVIKLSRAYHDQRIIKLYFAHDANHLYLAADVEDQQLWADGGGNGAGNIWESFDDDSIEWYFDLNLSKDRHLQNNDRFLALNIGNFFDPSSGSGIVSRRSYNAGNGLGGSTGVLDPNTLEGINYRIKHFGTVNKADDIDQGYSIEVAIPWSLLSNIPHADGNIIGINTIIISDDSGATRDFSDNRNIEPAELRFTLPILIDEYVELKHSEHHSSQSGLSGPSAYTVLQFHNRNDISPPAAVSNFSVDTPRPYSVKLHWNNSGDNNNQGFASNYDIRYSTEAISSENFNNAQAWPFNQKTDLTPFSRADIRVMGLQENTTYYFAVRAVDEAQNLGPIVFSSPISTTSIAALNTAIPENKYQGLIDISPKGRYFIKENGQAIIPIGTHYLHADVAIRHLYDGDIWNGINCQNHAQAADAEEKINAYFAQLKASGITVMRLFLEDFSLNVPDNSLFNEQNCAYWLENPRGNFNQKMADFMINILRLSAENGIYVLINIFDTFFYDDYLSRTAWHVNQGGPLTNINDFFISPDALEMSKTRWSWVINAINNSGYQDVVFGYEIMNEWDSFEWTKPSGDANTDAQIRIAFIEQLVNHVRSLDNQHLIISSSTALDPRGALASYIYDSESFDALLPHFYLPGNREPWNNPEQQIASKMVKEQANIFSWWTANVSNAKPILNGEWGPADDWLPNPDQPSYFSDFTEIDDELLTSKLWFSEFASGAAGPGIRMQGGVRSGGDRGLHLSDNMFATASTLSKFANFSNNTDEGLNFTEFSGENLQDSFTISNSPNSLIVTGNSDGKQGLIYLHQDKNQSNSSINNAQISLSSLLGGAAIEAEFWSTAVNQNSPKHIVKANPANLANPNDSQFTIPAFNDDWMIKFYEKYSTRLSIWREQGQHVINLDYNNMNNAGPVDVYLVYILNNQLFSLTLNEQGIPTSKPAIVPLHTNVSPADGLDELIRLPVTGNLTVDVYIATLATGTPVASFNFKTLQMLKLVI